MRNRMTLYRLLDCLRVWMVRRHLAASIINRVSDARNMLLRG